MIPVSTEFQNAWNLSAMRLKPRVVVEFGSNRFNDNQAVTATSTKPARRGFESPFYQKPGTYLPPRDRRRHPVQAQWGVFWKPEDVFNDKPRNTMKWLVCDRGATIQEEADGSGPRLIKYDEESEPTNYEKGWWSENFSDATTGIFDSGEIVETKFYTDTAEPFGRRVNRFQLNTTEGYPNMKDITVGYYDESHSYVEIEQIELAEDEYEHVWELEEDVIIYGLWVIVLSTWEPDDNARLTEFNATWVKDISEYVINADISETREDYDGAVPVGTTSANTLTVELDNTEGLFNTANNDSIYAPYIGANCRVEFSLGIVVNEGVTDPETSEQVPYEYEYIQMGEYWTDDWENDGGSVTARFSARDFSKFLQEEMTLWGRVWQNTNVVPVMRDVLLMLGLPLERITVDDSSERTYSILYLEPDEHPWEFFGEVAMADQGMFGFDKSGNFDYTTLATHKAIQTSVLSLDWDDNIVDANFTSELYATKVTVEVSATDVTETGTRSIWQPESPTILSWATVGTGGVTADATTIPVKRAIRQDTGNLTDNGWVDKGGYLFIPEFGLTTEGDEVVRYVISGEMIKYESRTDGAFVGCTRGYLDTEPQAWGEDQYIGEARYWDMDWDNSPAIQVKWPFVTAIDTLEKFPDEGTAQAYVIHFEADAFGGRLAIGNVVDYYTWLAGTGQSVKDFDIKTSDSEITFATSVGGQVAVEKPGSDTATAEEDISAENANWLRRYGKNEIQIANKWIQTAQHAQEFADSFIEEYRRPRRIIEMNAIVPPNLELGDVVTVINYPQLDIELIDFHVISIDYAYDGGLQASLTLREIPPV
jgi:hypothetical protein